MSLGLAALAAAGNSAGNAVGNAAGEDQQKAAPLGLFVLLLLGVACYFLFRSMSRHLKRVRDDFPAGPATASTPVRPSATRPVSATGRAAPEATVQTDRPATPDQVQDGRNPQ